MTKKVYLQYKTNGEAYEKDIVEIDGYMLANTRSGVRSIILQDEHTLVHRFKKVSELTVEEVEVMRGYELSVVNSRYDNLGEKVQSNNVDAELAKPASEGLTAVSVGSIDTVYGKIDGTWFVVDLGRNAILEKGSHWAISKKWYATRNDEAVLDHINQDKAPTAKVTRKVSPPSIRVKVKAMEGYILTNYRKTDRKIRPWEVYAVDSGKILEKFKSGSGIVGKCRNKDKGWQYVGDKTEAPATVDTAPATVDTAPAMSNDDMYKAFQEFMGQLINQ